MSCVEVFFIRKQYKQGDKKYEKLTGLEEVSCLNVALHHPAWSCYLFFSCLTRSFFFSCLAADSLSFFHLNILSERLRLSDSTRFVYLHRLHVGQSRDSSFHTLYGSLGRGLCLRWARTRISELRIHVRKLLE